jgi:hypothetical protein
VRVGEREGGGGLKVFEGLKHGELIIGERLPFEVRLNLPPFLLLSITLLTGLAVVANAQEVLAWVKWDERDPTAYSGESGSDCSPPPTGGDENT